MSFLKNIFENETVKNMAFGTVKKNMKEQGAKYMVVSLDANDELDMQMHGANVVIIPADQLAKAEQIMKEQEDQINAFRHTVEQLASQIDKLTEENEALYASGSAIPEQPAPGPLETSKTPVDGNSSTTA